jgi:hypothetical protein
MSTIRLTIKDDNGHSTEVLAEVTARDFDNPCFEEVTAPMIKATMAITIQRHESPWTLERSIILEREDTGYEVTAYADAKFDTIAGWEMETVRAALKTAYRSILKPPQFYLEELSPRRPAHEPPAEDRVKKPWELGCEGCIPWAGIICGCLAGAFFLAVVIGAFALAGL